ncbi:MAG: hypothetical protein IJA34_00420 [Lachnospiraceae bacterium]|nr:hypothetical protein [Lachnospiraceae bacterium]
MTDRMDFCGEICNYTGDIITEQKLEIERLNKEVNRLSECALYHDGQIADVVKDFAEELCKLFEGHSNYHGDMILTKITCLAEGKEVDAAKPLNEDDIKFDVIKRFTREFLEKLKKHHYLLSDRYNSTGYGMFTTGIEQAIKETEEKIRDGY